MWCVWIDANVEIEGELQDSKTKMTTTLFNVVAKTSEIGITTVCVAGFCTHAHGSVSVSATARKHKILINTHKKQNRNVSFFANLTFC